MLKDFITKTAQVVAPDWSERLFKDLWFRKQAQLLRKSLDACVTLEQAVELVFENEAFRADQKRNEILPVLKLLQEIQPRHLCEIGAAGGGTLILLCQAATSDARILSIDINYTPNQRKLHSTFARQDQRIRCLAADSHRPETPHAVEHWLSGQKLDFLFIDGDHSLAGVSQDYEMYARYVRQGGFIAFHDIVPDFLTRYGTRTTSDVGQVPAFWKTLVGTKVNAREIIEDPAQDGYGIGLLFV